MWAKWRQLILKERTIDPRRYPQLLRIFYHSATVDSSTHRQIWLDLPRCAMASAEEERISEAIQEAMHRILYTWSMLNPLIGYVQGMHDLLCVLVRVFDKQDMTPNDEAKLFAVFETFMEPIAGYYLNRKLLLSSASPKALQPNLLDAVGRLRRIAVQAFPRLVRHLDSVLDLQFSAFAYTWIAVRLTRQFDFEITRRLWGEILSMQLDSKEDYLIWICAGILGRCQENILKIEEFDKALMFLQRPSGVIKDEQDADELCRQVRLLHEKFRD